MTQHDVSWTAPAERATSPVNAWTEGLPWIDRDDADIDAYVASVRAPSTYDLASYLRQWRDNGIVIFQGVVSHADIDTMLDDIQSFHDNYTEYKVPIEIRGKQLQSDEAPEFHLAETGVKLNQLHCFSRAAARLSLTREVVDFIGHIFRGPAAVTQSLTFWRGSQQPIHIDYPYVRQQKILSYVAASWTPLEDIHPNSGPLGYYPGGHKFDKSGFFDWGDGSIIYDEKSTRHPMDFAHFLQAQMSAAKIERVDFCPKKGDVLIWHGNLPHEGTKVLDPERTRRSLVTHYTSLPNLPEWMCAPDAEQRGLGVFQNGGYAYEFPWLMDRKKLPSWYE